MSAGEKYIIVVEDDEIINESLCDLLSLNGYQVKTAFNGEKGFELIRLHHEDIGLIISDIMMPVMNGIEMLEAVKKDPKLRAIPFIFLTAKNDKETLKISLRRGAYDYIEKPFNNREVMQVISEVKEQTGLPPLANELDYELKLIENKLDEINRINSHQIRHSNAKILNILELLRDELIDAEEALSIISRMGENIENDTLSINNLVKKINLSAPKLNFPLSEHPLSRIWLVDDDATVNYIHRRILERELGTEILTFNDPLMAIKNLEQGHNMPDLIFLDINMPEMSGFDFLETISDRYKDVKVIMLSSSVSADDVSKAMSYDHVVSYYTKPLKRQMIDHLKNSDHSNSNKKQAV